MSTAELAQFLTPHLARSAPNAAIVVPYLLALDVVVCVGSIFVTFALPRWVARLGPAEKLTVEQKGLPITLRQAYRYLNRTRNTMRIIAVIAVAVALSLNLAGYVVPVLTEVLLMVLLLALLAPMYFAVAILAGAFQQAADLMTQR